MDNREIDMSIQEAKDHFIDRSLVFFEKPMEKIMNKTISLYHGSYEVIHDKLKPMGVNVGATKYSKIRWSTYYWDNFESAVRWSVAWAVKKFGEVGVMWPIRKEHGTKILLRNNKGISDDEFKNEIARQKIVTYVYEIKIPANDIEMGSVASIKEYTISHPVKIYKTHSIIITKDMIDRYFRIVDEDEWKDAREANKFECLVYNRGPILNKILNNHRDPYRIIVKKAQRDGLINVGDDLSGYKQKIEHSIKYDTLGLNIKEENSIMEEYDLYEEDAIDLILESYEKEFDEYMLEDLTEAIDILIEDYGFDEDYATEIVLETVKHSAKNIATKAFDSYITMQGNLTKDMLDKKEVYDYAKRRIKNDKNNVSPEDYKLMKKSYNKVRNNYAKATAKMYAPAVAPYIVAGSAYAIHKAYKKHKAKKDLKKR